MRPYYEAPGIVIYNGDCREVLPSLAGLQAIVSDPPYGINYSVSARNYSNARLKALKPCRMEAKPSIAGDDRPFDVTPLLPFRKVALFGANHLSGLPVGGRWIVWDKRRDSTRDYHSDCEFVWTNRPGADRIHRQKWRGIVREGEENCSRSRKLHPNQKPVALIDFVFSELGIVTGDLVSDPYMGSGSTGIVSLRRGNRFVGIEIDERICETAVLRIQSEFAEGLPREFACAV